MWLNEIEEDIEIELEVKTEDAQRMARVLREQSEVLILANHIDWEVVIDLLTQENMALTKHSIISLWNRLSKLPDDAKELLK